MIQVQKHPTARYSIAFKGVATLISALWSIAILIHKQTKQRTIMQTTEEFIVQKYHDFFYLPRWFV